MRRSNLIPYLCGKKNKPAMKDEELKRLQDLQAKYLSNVDMQIGTRKDLSLTMVSYCNYLPGFIRKSKLYIHKLSWEKDNALEIEEIEKNLKIMTDVNFFMDDFDYLLCKAHAIVC